MTPARQAWISILAMLLFALIMSVFWVATHGLGQEFGMGFACGGLFFGAVVIAAVGWRRPETLLPPRR